ncbi:MAG: 3-hydroxyacyl-CoA dehydrogenase NAD-binding domain-containing protein [Gemmatimonadaceae bacterium]
MNPTDADGVAADRTPRSVAVVGVGVIGRSWMRVFTRAGCETRAWDPNAEALSRALTWHDEELRRDNSTGGTLRRCDSLEEALDDVEYVQENGPESLEQKQRIYRELDRLAPGEAILASSTSAIDMTEIARGLAREWRCVVAHPVNPPHVVPVVEVLGGKNTRPTVVQQTAAFMRAVGQKPVVLNTFVPGFLLNRLQVALLREAISLVERGVADTAAIDAVVQHGLGLRWALLGPFGVANTNADGGVREYLERFAGSLDTLMRDLGDTPRIDKALVERIGRQTDATTGATPLAEIRRWRDRMVSDVVRLKRENPQP